MSHVSPNRHEIYFADSAHGTIGFAEGKKSDIEPEPRVAARSNLADRGGGWKLTLSREILATNSGRRVYSEDHVKCVCVAEADALVR